MFDLLPDDAIHGIMLLYVPQEHRNHFEQYFTPWMKLSSYEEVQERSINKNITVKQGSVGHRLLQDYLEDMVVYSANISYQQKSNIFSSLHVFKNNQIVLGIMWVGRVKVPLQRRVAANFV